MTMQNKAARRSAGHTLTGPSSLDERPALVSIDPYALSSRLACLPLPTKGEAVRSADDLLAALVFGSDSQGRYYADARLLRRLFWWQETSSRVVERWLGELVVRGDVNVRPLARDCYSDSWVSVVSIINRQRFQRFSDRRVFSAELRAAVYWRDGHQCVGCGSRKRLSLDHIRPWSLGGTDDLDNLQTFCCPCNSRKGARV